ncbi:hypothetical protein KSP39_PZI017314 [Platanthera zijinensis]|uniref:At4g15545-like C-terminal domain-containing protein n=1 Tax=Platanthera zijinensis TaxID=2320716 RepID=A0AAP0B4F0_9ASPA
MADGEDQPQQPNNVSASASAIGFNLPEPILAVLPTDPFDQLDVARKITSIALATRLANFEDEIDGLRRAVADRDDIIADLSVQLQETLLNENASLSNTVKKLNRDVSKLEVFKKSLMQSLQEESESPFTSCPSFSGEDSSNPPPKFSSTFETVYSNSNDDDFGDNDVFKLGTLRRLDLSSRGGTPRLTPPGSPPRLATGVTPKRLSRPLSPRRHSISVATTKNMSDNRSGIFSSIPPTRNNSMASPFDTSEPTGRSRVDGKEFFRQVRNRLSDEQFNAFLSNVKELNSHKQTRGETLRRADEIFGPENKDLFTIFDGLINRNLH